MHVLMLVGSLRADSLTRRLSQATAGLAPDGVEFQTYDGLGDLPHYSQELDTEHPPASVVDFRAAVAAADGLLVATPEYNGSIPGVLKNAIDWASRPRGGAAIGAKPVAVLSVSPSPRGAQWAREDAAKILRIAGARPLEHTVGVPSAHAAVVDGYFVDFRVEAELTALMSALVSAADAAQIPAA